LTIAGEPGPAVDGGGSQAEPYAVGWDYTGRGVLR
jgi:hypothetical protein